jgi:hypothetical protein
MGPSRSLLSVPSFRRVKREYAQYSQVVRVIKLFVNFMNITRWNSDGVYIFAICDCKLLLAKIVHNVIKLNYIIRFVFYHHQLQYKGFLAFENYVTSSVAFVFKRTQQR